MNGKWIKIGSVLATLLLVSSALYLYSRNIDPKSGVYADNSQELSLTPPTFLATAAATYLEQEAGISIYVNTTGPLNLDTAKSVMINIENATSDYVVGSLNPWGSSTEFSGSDDYPHCFVHKDGWIVVYYLTPKPGYADQGWLGKIVDWRVCDPISDPITDNLLYDGLRRIATQLGKQGDLPTAKYYHFQHPAATKLLFAVKKASSDTIATFNIYIPGTLTIYERSWSCYSNVWGTTLTHTFKIGDNQISRSYGRRYGGLEITAGKLPSNTYNVISISADSYYGNAAYVCLILLYS